MNYFRIFRNAFFNLLSLVVAIATAFYLYPFLIKHLGESRYGVWALLGSVTGYLGIFDFGIAMAVTKYVAEYHQRNEPGKLRSVIWTGTRLYFYTSFGAVVMAGVFYGLFPLLFNLDAVLVREAKAVLLVVALDVMFSFWFVTVRAGLEGLQRFDITNLTNILATLFRTGIIVLLVRSGFGLMSLAVTALVINRLSELSMLIGLKRELQLFSSPAQAAIPLSQIFYYSLFVFIEMVALRIFYYTDNLVIGVMLSASAITHYAAAFSLVEAVRNLTHKMMVVLMPVVSEISVEDKAISTVKLQRLFTSGSRLAGVFATPILLAMILTGKSFIAAWVGPGFEDGYWCLVVLAIPQIWILSQSVGIRIIYGLAVHKNYAYYSAVISLVNLGLSLALARPLGILGVALGTSISILLGRVYMNDYFRRILQIRLLPYYWNVWKRLAVLSIGSGLILYLAFKALQPESIFFHLLIYAGYFILFETAALFLVLEPEEQALTLGLYRSWRKRDSHD